MNSRICQKCGISNSFATTAPNKTEKELYWQECQFKFDPYTESQIKGYDLLLKHGLNGKTKLHRDHMLSIHYGWVNNISSDIISHPANCEILFDIDNMRKNSNSSITVEDLIARIKNWDSEIGIQNKNNKNTILKTKKTLEHRQKISASLRNKITINNGVIQKRINKGDEIPFGFVLGPGEAKTSSGRITFFDKTNNERSKLNLEKFDDNLKHGILSRQIFCDRSNINLYSSNIESELENLKKFLKLKNLNTVVEILGYYNISTNNSAMVKSVKNTF